MLDYRNSHDPNRSSTGYEDVLAQNWERKRGVDSVAKWIKDGGDLFVDPRMVPPYICHRKRDQFGKGSGAINPDTLRHSTKMPPSRQAVPASATNDVALSAHDVPWTKIVDVRPD